MVFVVIVGSGIVGIMGFVMGFFGDDRVCCDDAVCDDD